MAVERLCSCGRERNIPSLCRRRLNTAGRAPTSSSFRCEAPRGDLIPLSNLVTVREAVAPKQLNHYEKLRAVTISASVDSGSTLSQSLASLEKLARKHLPPGASISYSGESKEFKESSRPPLYYVPPCAAGHLSRISRAVRKFCASGDNSVVGSSGDYRRPTCSELMARHPEHLSQSELLP